MPPEKSEHTMQVSQTTPDEHPPTPPPCRWSARITLRTSTKFQHVDAASVVMTYVLFRSPSLCYPRIGLVVNIIYIRRYFDQINILSYVRPGLYCFEVRLELYDGDGPSSSLMSPSHPPTPRPCRWPALTTFHDIFPQGPHSTINSSITLIISHVRGLTRVWSSASTHAFLISFFFPP